MQIKFWTNFNYFTDVNRIQKEKETPVYNSEWTVQLAEGQSPDSLAEYNFIYF